MEVDERFVVERDYNPYKVLETMIYSWQVNGETLTEVTPDDINGVLKVTVTTQGTNFFIKKGPLNQFYDPWSMYNNGKNSLKYKDQYGRTWNWARVPREAYEQYVSFLKTRNKTRYTAATRLYLYGADNEKG